MTEFSNQELVGTFLDHIRYLKIVHHVNGRIRVKANWNTAKKLSNVGTDEIEQVMVRIPGIDRYRVNKKALSVIIEYNPSVLPFSLWEDVGNLSEYPLNRKEVEERLLTILEENPKEN